MGSGDWTAHLQRAQQLVAEERAVVDAERDAFEAFRRRVADRPPPKPDGGPPGGLATRTLVESNPILEEYRTTVMSVSHYESDYGEDALENMRIEFGSEVADLVGRGAPSAYPAVVGAATTAVAERDVFLGELEDERESLERTERELLEIHQVLEGMAGDAAAVSADDRFAALDRLDDLVDGAETLLANRQRTLRAHDRALSPGEVEPPPVVEYLYTELPVRYPALDALATLVSHIEDVQEEYRASLLD